DQRGAVSRGYVHGSWRLLDDLLGGLPLGHALSLTGDWVPKGWRLLRGAAHGVPEPPCEYFRILPVYPRCPGPRACLGRTGQGGAAPGPRPPPPRPCSDV